MMRMPEGRGLKLIAGGEDGDGEGLLIVSALDDGEGEDDLVGRRREEITEGEGVREGSGALDTETRGVSDEEAVFSEGEEGDC
jgi:hypothetical protein